MSFLQNLSFRRKFGLIALLALVMLSIPSAMFLQRVVASLGQIDHEIAGLPPAKALVQVARLSAQHRGLSNAVLNGDASAQPKREQLWQALQAMRAVSEQAVASLGDASLVRRMSDIWQKQETLAAAVKAGSLPAADSFVGHSGLIVAQLELLYDVTVRSELVLNPWASGYHLQDAALNHLPLAAESLGQLRGRGMGLLVKGEAATPDRVRLAVLAEVALRDAEVGQRSLALAIEAEPGLAAALGDLPAKARKSLDEALALARTGIIEPATPTQPAADWWARMSGAIDDQVKLGDAAMVALEADLAEHRGSDLMSLAGTAALVLALATLGAWLLWAIASGTTRSIERAIALADAVAAGDLTRRGPAPDAGSHDEGARLVSALSKMSQQLGSVVSTVLRNADQVATASAQIAQGNQDLSERTESQASALEETAASMEELRTTLGHSADNARQADQLAQQASAVAGVGGEAVSGLVATMEEIRQSSQQIAAIISTIDGIAFQTNILALNAAVEAARAGEQGRGFAVVASEVRALAQRSAEAAREIRGLIATSQERVASGSARGSEAASTMQEVVGSIGRVSTLIAAVSAAVQQQNAGVAQVGEAVTQMDQATQQNAALVEQSAAAAASLRQQAGELQRAMANFKVAAF
jgi:methyl-accepting chemotaxis protein